MAQENLADIRCELLLLAEGSVKSPTIRQQLLQRAIIELLGAESPLLKSFDPPGSLPVEGGDYYTLLSDLKMLASTSGSLGPVTTASSDIPDDDGLKDRISRVFMSSMAFKVCAGALAVGTALFGINLGFLTLDTSRINQDRTLAATAIVEAKTAADDAKAKVAAVLADAQVNLPKDVINKLNLQDIQAHVVSGLTDILAPKLTDVNTKIGQEGTDIAANGLALQKLVEKLNAVQDKANAAQTKVGDAQRLLDRWESAVTVAQNTTMDQSIARTIWFVLRQDGKILIASLILSMAASVVSLLAFLRKR